MASSSVKKARAKARRTAAAKKRASAKKPAAKPPKRAPLTKPAGTTCKVKRVRTKSGRRKTVKVCTRPAKPTPTASPGTTATPAAPLPTTPSGAPVVLPAPAVAPTPDPTPAPGPVPATPRDFTVADADRLLWRAGFGPIPGQAEQVAAAGLDAAIDRLVRPSGTAQLVGPAPRDDDGNALAPLDLWGHDHAWWLDRMVRSDQPLVERMTLIWHDWFATARGKVGSARLMLDQNELLRRNALGNFRTLLREVTRDPAMLVFLDGVSNTRWNPNENYAREVMELFTLGANRGAYTEQDVREAARAFTGFTGRWDDGIGWNTFRYDPNRHATGSKTIFGRTGAFGWQEAADLCVDHPLHASFFVTKLWGYFVPEPPDAATQAALHELYVGGGHEIAPVVEAILRHPALLRGPAMVKPPVVHQAGMLRALGRGVDTIAWSWLGENAGQQLFDPPNVAGWGSDWLDTSRWRARWDTAAAALMPSIVDPWSATSPYDPLETPQAALDRALEHCGRPRLTPETTAALLAFATTSIPLGLATWARGPRRGLRQNALRLLILTSSDVQTS